MNKQNDRLFIDFRYSKHFFFKNVEILILLLFWLVGFQSEIYENNRSSPSHLKHDQKWGDIQHVIGKLDLSHTSQINWQTNNEEKKRCPFSFKICVYLSNSPEIRTILQVYWFNLIDDAEFNLINNGSGDTFSMFMSTYYHITRY